MARGTKTTPAPITHADRKWRVNVLCALITIFAVCLAGAIVPTVTTLGNREIGKGNRVVECTTLHHVAPEVHLEQCDGTSPTNTGE